MNQRIEASSPFVTPQQWKACGGEPLDLRGRDVFGGLDLSETKDLTALVLIGCDIRDGSWSAQPTFWLPAQGLADKARADRVPYDTWQAKVSLSKKVEAEKQQLTRLFCERDARNDAVPP